MIELYSKNLLKQSHNMHKNQKMTQTPEKTKTFHTGRNITIYIYIFFQITKQHHSNISLRPQTTHNKSA